MPPVAISRIPYALDGFLRSVLPDGLFVAWDGVQAKAPESALWVRPTCIPGGILDGEKGKDGYAPRTGLYYVEVMAPHPVLPKRAWELAGTIETAFRREQVECINFGDPHTENLGVDQYNVFRVRVVIEWWCWTV